MLTSDSSEPEAESGNSQARTKELAEKCLHSNPYLALENVSCDYHDGELILLGFVPTYHLKDLAQQVVAGLEGVERIDNEIQVVMSAFPPRKG